MDELIRTLHEGGHTLVLYNNTSVGDTIQTFNERGVLTLYRLLTSGSHDLQGAILADKVVGKAAAALMILGGVKEIHVDVISQLALDLFEGSSVEVGYTAVVPHIINRAGDGWCPMETRCRDCRTAEECLVQVELFLKQMAGGSASR